MSINPPSRSIIKDFHRDVWCLFGLPIDNLTMESAKRLIREKVKDEGTHVLSTVNVNWVVEALRNPSFRAAIIKSDIVTIDGQPLLWLAKLLGYPMKEVIAGSSLIEEFLNEKCTSEQPITLYIFGGEDGVAKRAMERVNQKNGGLRAVGFCSPGFGSVEEMSSKIMIDEINAVKPDILLVSLGAKKGTQWIEHNKKFLKAKVICHLGATVNFLAGTVVRSPKFLQKIGMEWVWRILQEPKLTKRYVTDGLVLLRILFSSFLLWVKYLYWKSRFEKLKNAVTSICAEECAVRLVLGSISKDDGKMIQTVFSKCVSDNKDVQIDFKETEFIDGNFLGLLLILAKNQEIRGNSLVLINLSVKLQKLLRLFHFSGICNIQICKRSLKLVNNTPIPLQASKNVGEFDS